MKFVCSLCRKLIDERNVIIMFDGKLIHAYCKKCYEEKLK